MKCTITLDTCEEVGEGNDKFISEHSWLWLVVVDICSEYLTSTTSFYIIYFRLLVGCKLMV